MSLDLAALRTKLKSKGFQAADVPGSPNAGIYTALFAFAAGRQAGPVIQAIGASAAQHFPAYAMDAVPRIAEFIAQTSHETGDFTRFEENLNYSAQRLAAVWPNRFAVAPKAKVKQPNAAALALGGKPEAIANNVYMRAEEGNIHPGDGWRFRGRGMLQLTFRNNYAAASKRLNLDLTDHPDLAADPATSLLISLDFWQHGKVNACCDCGDFFGARGITNCGSKTPKVPPIGLDDVKKRRDRLMTLFT